MKKSDLAAALGVHPSQVTRMSRQGMPTDSVEAARAWRKANVAPYVRTPATAAATPADGPLQDPADVIEGLVRDYTMVPRAVLPELIRAVDAAVVALTAAGADPEPLRPVLCQFLQATAADDRRLSLAAWRLVAGVRA